MNKFEKLGDEMAQAIKLQIIGDKDTIDFEKGKDKVKSIEIKEERGIIKIEFTDPEWDYLIIPFNTLMSFKYKEEIKFVY